LECGGSPPLSRPYAALLNLTFAVYPNAYNTLNIKSVEMSFVLRFRIAVTRVRDVPANLATSRCVNPFRATTSAILVFKSLRSSSSAPPAGVKPSAFANSLPFRAATALVFLIKQLRQPFLFQLQLIPRGLGSLFCERMKHQHNSCQPRVTKIPEDPGTIPNPQLFHSDRNRWHRPRKRHSQNVSSLQIKDGLSKFLPHL
jgi:hypothetical protein